MVRGDAGGAGELWLNQLPGTVMRTSLYMVVELFKDGNAEAVYERFRARGRLAPDGLAYVSSWVDVRLERCFQLMETQSPELLDQWMANWADLVDFEVYPVMTSADAARHFLE